MVIASSGEIGGADGSTAAACLETVTILCEAAGLGTLTVMEAVVVDPELLLGPRANAADDDTKSGTVLKVSIETH